MCFFFKIGFPFGCLGSIPGNFSNFLTRHPGISSQLKFLIKILIYNNYLFSSHIKLMSALDSSWVVNSNNGLHAHGHPHWLQLTLAAAKLLDLAVLLPAQHLPQFQMYRWAFVSDPISIAPATQEEEALNCHDFVPHVKRISKLMDAKVLNI